MNWVSKLRISGVYFSNGLISVESQNCQTTLDKLQLNLLNKFLNLWKRCCAPFELGGLNVVDFRTKCLSLRLSCFSSLRDNFRDSKLHYLTHYFMGTRLTRLDKHFDFRSNLFPVSVASSNFYHKALESF